MTSGHERALEWDGLLNGRELGGIRSSYGRVLRGRLVRSASVHTLSAIGWQELVDHGIRSVVDLRHDWEMQEAAVPATLRRREVAMLHQPLEPPGYVDGWSDREDRWKLSTPYYLDEFMTEHALRVGHAIKAIAAAPPGGVLVHCYAGKDRAGLTVAMMLNLLGVDHETIVADYWISFDRARSLELELGKAEAPGKPALDERAYATVMSDLLAAYPSTSCFANTDEARSVRDQLAERLCRSPDR